MNTLPTLDDARIDEIERELFTRIAQDRTPSRTSAPPARRRRRTGWVLGGAAAAVLLVAVVIAPYVAGSIGGPVVSTADGSAADETVFQSDTGRAADGGAELFAEGGAADAATAEAAPAEETAATGREVIATASAQLVAADPAAAAEEIADRATAAGGYVESLQIDGAVAPSVVESDAAAWAPVGPGTRVSVRVPADALTEVIDGLGELGEVVSSQISRDDVTTQTVDLRARVTAGEASVERLTALLGDAGSVADLVAAESALAARQAELESLRQQLAWYESQVSLSTLTVEVLEEPVPVDADPAGFGDGLTAGWNGLIASANAVIIALGFLAPWVAVLALAVAAVWLVRRAVLRRRARRAATPSATPADEV